MDKRTIVRRLADLDETLADFEPKHRPSWQLAQIYNTLLEEARRIAPKDPVVKVIEPVRQSLRGGAATDCGTLRAATMQLLGALGR